jgi:hypothetical protein
MGFPLFLEPVMDILFTLPAAVGVLPVTATPIDINPDFNGSTGPAPPPPPKFALASNPGFLGTIGPNPPPPPK